MSNAKEADLRNLERHVSEDISPIQDTKRTDLKIAEREVVFVAAAIL